MCHHICPAGFGFNELRKTFFIQYKAMDSRYCKNNPHSFIDQCRLLNFKLFMQLILSVGWIVLFLNSLFAFLAYSIPLLINYVERSRNIP